ncbi:TonB-dependent siderophore receptor [Azospirillum sp. ST 5-10]|uniref:TonB-dependent siderophore receptor n=1 Tax=unclassified Azospirillum TaxID=2630922 RepID=UPI003F49EFE6
MKTMSIRAALCVATSRAALADRGSWRRAMIAGSLGLSLAAVPQAVRAAELDIAAQPLADALVALGRQANVQVLFNQSQVQGVRSPAVRGDLSVGQALDRLLTGTGFTYEIDGNSVVLTRPQTGGDVTVLPPVRVGGQAESATGPVDGYVARQTATGTKTDTPLIEVPQAISVITPEQLQDRNVQVESEALLYTPGIFAQPFGSALNQSNNFYRIRGFATSSGGSYVDSLVSPVNYRYEPFAYERIEVLRGPTSVLFGQADAGGLINRVSKRPRADSIREIEVEYGTHDWKQLAFDVGGAVDEEGRFLYRLVGMGRDAEGAVDWEFGEDIADDRSFIAPAFTWNVTPDTSLTLLASRLKEDADQIVPHTAPGYDVTDIRLDQDRGVYNDYEDYSFGYAFEHRFDDSLLFQQNLRMSYLNYDYVTLGQVNSVDTPPTDGHIVDRYGFGFKERREDFTIDSRLQKTLTWGITEHTVLVGFDFQRLEDKYSFSFGAAPSLDLWAPDYDQYIPVPEAFQTTRATTYNRGLYLQDQIKIDQRWVLTLGARKDWSRTTLEDLLSGGEQAQEDDAMSYRAGLTYLFDNGLAPYLSYTESFLPTGGSDINGDPFEPTTGQQYEVGVKYQPTGFRGFFTAALFDLTKQNVTTTDPDNVGFSVQTGEVRSRGLELEATAEIADGLKLQAAYTFLDAEVTESNSGSEGDVPAQTPKHMASLWLDYALPASLVNGLSVGGGVRYVSSTYAWDATTASPERRKNDAYTLFDAALRYDLGQVDQRLDGARVALNVHNIFDKDYQVCYSRFDCQPGVSRTVIGSLVYRW